VSLAALERGGQCYGGCGRVSLTQLLDVYMTRPEGTGA
jgi:hypothetical protein